MKIVINHVPVENHVTPEWSLVKDVTVQANTTDPETFIENCGITETGLYKFVVTPASRFYMLSIRTRYNQSKIVKVEEWISANATKEYYGNINDTKLEYINHTGFNQSIELACPAPQASAFDINVKIYKAV